VDVPVNWLRLHEFFAPFTDLGGYPREGSGLHALLKSQPSLVVSTLLRPLCPARALRVPGSGIRDARVLRAAVCHHAVVRYISC
jgi:hypothetical protein